ncbi:MAG: hypothetical protein ACREXT_08215 [Gammaproteobacteria bacterium]
MTSGYGPDKLGSRHFLMALMHAAGFRNVDIARQLGYTESRVSIIINSPLFQAQVRDLQGELRDATLGDAMATIEREAGNSVRVLVDIRDAGENGNVRRLAANDLLDRHPSFARRSANTEEHVVRVSFGPRELAQMLRALPPGAEGGGRHQRPDNGSDMATGAVIDVTAAPRLQSLDDALTEARE